MSKTLLFIHGMWGGGWYWQPYIEFFEAQGYQCLAPTLRHHDLPAGELPPQELGSLSLIDYVSDLNALIDTLDERPIIIGHSMGGLIAQKLAEQNRAAALVLLSPAPPSDVPALTWGGIKSFLGLLKTWGFWRKPHRPTFASCAFSSFAKMPEAQQQDYYQRMTYESGWVVIEAALPFLDRRRAAAVDTEKVHVPMLVLCGSDDLLLPPKIAVKVAAKYPQAQYQTIADQTHWLMNEPGWEQSAAVLSNWLSQLGTNLFNTDHQ